MLSPIMRIIGCFRPKARLWPQGRRDIFSRISSAISLGDKIVWFHAASLGEFEQGRPLIELMRERHPEYKILITFFSPTGYQIRKNYEGADYVFYLPSDTPANVRRFMSIVRPQAAFFIKYEFWLNYLAALRKEKVPTFLVSAVFRPKQVFFRFYGGIFREGLGSFSHIFTQNNESIELLKSIGFERTTIIGDTRVDRVYEIASSSNDLPVVQQFASKADGSMSDVFVAGSTWPADENMLLELVNACPNSKFVIAPHEIEMGRIKQLRSKIKGASVLYTDFSSAASEQEIESLRSAQVLFLNTVGVLSSAYKYGHAAYIGGGFGVGIHNTLEAATFGLPLAFGPNYHRFCEACELIDRSGAVCVNNSSELQAWFDNVVSDNKAYTIASSACKNYVTENIGATKAVIDFYESQYVS